MSRVENIRDAAFETLDLDVAEAWQRKALAWAGKLDQEQMEHIATRLQLQATMRQAEQLESLVGELVEARDSFRLAAEDAVGRESTLGAELEEALARVAELEVKVAELTIADSATYYGAQRDLLVSLWREIDGEQEGDTPANHLMETGLIQRFRSLEAEVAALRESPTVDVPPVEVDAPQYPRVEWGGGQCPLPREVCVYLWVRKGSTNDGGGRPQPAWTLDWSHEGDELAGYKLTAYRIAPDSEQTPEGLAALHEYLRTHEPDGTRKADSDTEPPTGVWIPHAPGPCPYPTLIGRVRFASGEETPHEDFLLRRWEMRLWAHINPDSENNITHFMLKP